MLDEKKIIQIANAVEVPVSRGIYAYLNAFAKDIEKELSKNSSEAKLLEVEKAITKYYLALDKREHAGYAEIKAFDEIQDALGMSWQQGEALRKFQQNPELFKFKDDDGATNE